MFLVSHPVPLMTPGCLRGPGYGIRLWNDSTNWVVPSKMSNVSWCQSLDLDEDHDVDLYDIAIMQNDEGCSRLRHETRPLRNIIDSCEQIP